MSVSINALLEKFSLFERFFGGLGGAYWIGGSAAAIIAPAIGGVFLAIGTILVLIAAVSYYEKRIQKLEGKLEEGKISE